MPRPTNENLGDIPCCLCGRDAFLRRQKGKGLFYIFCPGDKEKPGCRKVSGDGPNGQVLMMANAKMYPPGGVESEPAKSLVDSELAGEMPVQEPVQEPGPGKMSVPVEPREEAGPGVFGKLGKWLSEEID